MYKIIWIIFIFGKHFLCECSLIKDYTMFSIHLNSEVDKDEIESFMKDEKVILMNYPFGIHDDVQLLIHRDKEMEAEYYFNDHKMKINWINKKVHNPLNMRSSYVCGVNNSVTWKCYNNYESIDNWLHNLAKHFYLSMDLRTIGKTSEGRSIYGVMIKKTSNELPLLVIEAGIYGDAWITIYFALYMINNILKADVLDNQRAMDLSKRFNFMIIPVANPDGYEYSYNYDRSWKKNRQKLPRSIGVNLNKNFGYHFNITKSKHDPNDVSYPGPAAFSEKETIAIKHLVESLGSELNTYIALHETSVSIKPGKKKLVRVMNDDLLDFEDFDHSLQEYNKYTESSDNSGDSVSWVKNEMKKNAYVYYIPHSFAEKTIPPEKLEGALKRQFRSFDNKKFLKKTSKSNSDMKFPENAYFVLFLFFFF